MSRRPRIKPNGWLHFLGFVSTAMAGVALTMDAPSWFRGVTAFALGALGMTLIDLAYRHGKRETARP